MHIQSLRVQIFINTGSNLNNNLFHGCVQYTVQYVQYCYWGFDHKSSLIRNSAQLVTLAGPSSSFQLRTPSRVSRFLRHRSNTNTGSCHFSTKSVANSIQDFPAGLGQNSAKVKYIRPRKKYNIRTPLQKNLMSFFKTRSAPKSDIILRYAMPKRRKVKGKKLVKFDPFW